MLVLALLGGYAVSMIFVALAARRQRKRLGPWVHLHDPGDRMRWLLGE